MSQAKGKIAVAYLRRSTSKQEESLDTQLRWAIAKADEMGYELDADVSLLGQMESSRKFHLQGVFIDDAVSGSEESRPGLDALRTALRSRQEIAALLVVSRDRLARFRDALDGAVLERELLRHGITIVTDTEVIQPTSSGQQNFARHIVSLFSSYNAGEYNYKLAETVLRAQEKNAAAGLWNGGSPPYGFKRVAIDKSTKRVVSPAELSANQDHAIAVVPGTDAESIEKLERVRWIHDYYAMHGGLSAVARELNRMGVPSPSAGRKRKGKLVSGKWSVGTVRNILENPLYIGQLAWGRTAQGKNYRRDPNQPGVKVRMEQWEPVTVNRDSDTWAVSDPILDYRPVVNPVLWQANNRRLRERAKKSGQSGVRKASDPDRYPIKVVRCADCGQPMTGVARNNGDLVTYSCSTYHSSREKPRACYHNWVLRDQLVWFVLDTLRRLLGDENGAHLNQLRSAVRRELKETLAPQADDAQLDAFKEERHELRDKIKQAMADKYDSPHGVVRETAEELIEEYSAKERKLSKKIRGIEERLDVSSHDLDHEVEGALSLLTQWRTLAERAPKRGISRLMAAVGAEVTVEFDHPKTGRRKGVPVRAHLAFNPNPALLATTETDALGAVSRKTAVSVSPVGNTGSPKGGRSLRKGNRGGRT